MPDLDDFSNQYSFIRMYPYFVLQMYRARAVGSCSTENDFGKNKGSGGNARLTVGVG